MLKKIIMVTMSQVVKLLSSVIVAFIIPKFLGVTDFGHYKTYILYLTYCGVLYFGFSEGIYLKYGDKEYSELNKEKFRMYTRFLLIMETFVSIIMMIIAILVLKGDQRIIFICLGINLIGLNLTYYYQFVSQITGRFKEFSIRTLLHALGTLLIIGIMIIFKIKSYYIYIGLTIGINYLLLMWYMITYRSITFGKAERIRDNRKDILGLFKLGIPLLLSSLVGVLILQIDNQIISLLFDIETFSIYSFAYNMLNMIIVFVSAISLVLYPTLKRMSEEKALSNYSNYNSIILIVVSLGLIGYFPLKLIIPWLLPDFKDSLIIFRIALPGLMFTSAITAIKFNFFKILGKSNMYMLFGVVALGVTIGLNFLFYNIFKTTESIALSTVIGMLVWYVLLEIYFIKKYKVKFAKNGICTILIVATFYGLTIIENVFLSGGLYILSAILVIGLVYRKDLKVLFKIFAKEKEIE